MLDRIRFAKLMLGLGEIYDKQITEFVADVYYEILEGYEYEILEDAVKKVISSHKFNSLPKPADILEFLEGTRDDKALVAWLQVMEAVQKGGYYTSIEFADSIIAPCVLELGGWQWFCTTQKDELPFIQKRFMDLYRLFLKQGVQGNIRLIGFIEARNNQSGHLKDIPEPIRIGFDEKTIKKLEDKSSSAPVKI